jgi:hypothetical protein
MTYIVTEACGCCRALLRWFKGSFLMTMFDNYRPEQHYMRGSGPKSRSMDSNQDAGSKEV